MVPLAKCTVLGALSSCLVLFLYQTIMLPIRTLFIVLLMKACEDGGWQLEFPQSMELIETLLFIFLVNLLGYN